ncbi:MAG: glycosyltransferase family 2 protein [Pseudomonadota bacterium]
MTKISVIMCTYNGERYLTEQLDSIAMQTRPPDELVIVDDHSSDNTPELLRDYARTSPLSIHIHENKTNLGYKANFLKALGLGTGDLLFLADQDDVWAPEKVAVFACVFAMNPKAAVVYSDSHLVDSGGRCLGSTLWQSLRFCTQEQARLQSASGFELCFRRGNLFCGCSMALTRRFRDIALPYPHTMQHDLWLGNLACTTEQLALLDTPLIAYRQHGAQTSGDKTPTIKNRIRGKLKATKTFSDTRYYDLWIDEHEALEQRLRDLGYSAKPALHYLEDKIAYLRCQRTIHGGGRLARLPRIAEQVTTGRHRRFGRGLKSLLVDLLM